MLIIIIAFVLVAISLVAAIYNTVLYFRYRKSSPIALLTALFCAIAIVIMGFVAYTGKS